MKVSLARKRSSHKGTFGHVLILAGARGMVGASYLTTVAALRSGAGKVTLGAVREVYQIIGPSVPEALSLIVKGTPAGTISSAALRQILAYAKKVRVVALGPGLSTHPSTQKLVRALVADLPCQLILDADGINCLRDGVGALKKARLPVIVTPHEGEMRVLAPRAVASDVSSRKTVAKKIAKQYHCILVRKGDRTLGPMI